jgi:hypothetical protein
MTRGFQRYNRQFPDNPTDRPIQSHGQPEARVEVADPFVHRLLEQSHVRFLRGGASGPHDEGSDVGDQTVAQREHVKANGRYAPLPSSYA